MPLTYPLKLAPRLRCSSHTRTGLPGTPLVVFLIHTHAGVPHTHTHRPCSHACRGVPHMHAQAFLAFTHRPSLHARSGVPLMNAPAFLACTGTCTGVPRTHAQAFNAFRNGHVFTATCVQHHRVCVHVCNTTARVHRPVKDWRAEHARVQTKGLAACMCAAPPCAG